MEKVKADITDKVGIEHFKAGQNILAAKDDELNDRINHNLEKIINLEESNVIQQQKAKYVDTLNERLTMEIEAKQQSEVLQHRLSSFQGRDIKILIEFWPKYVHMLIPKKFQLH